MNRTERYLAAVRARDRVTIPGAVVPLLGTAIAAVVLVVLNLSLVIAGDNDIVRLLALLVGSSIAAAFVWTLVALANAFRTYQCTPTGLSYRGSRELPWGMLRGAHIVIERGGETGTQREIVAGLTPQGIEWVRRHGGLRLRTALSPRHSALKVQRARGCSKDETARLLAETIAHRRARLGLPPVA
ncbi:hypothetical protein GCM10011490_26670 [Pseudoclavibacter endophyticus]|uniref:PH domain-containing protein n=1 Tax=Pseudoclavibacter endophyticus TaxID=1778590 RepID=A0A6H9WAV9_9MICO|nr:hypothetical protein [Pseudoclavibacter endophyticus]KAB1646894.1 hypothetical protein F8O04_14310 [Pseudoclavibacter endophyticus]GGA74639.1 hypothetical protein GCM10011490_26670 [Pseudoclavibacter endophyticus]